MVGCLGPDAIKYLGPLMYFYIITGLMSRSAGLLSPESTTNELIGLMNFFELVLFKFKREIYDVADAVVLTSQRSIDRSLF